jgi:hypothetical protein
MSSENRKALVSCLENMSDYDIRLLFNILDLGVSCVEYEFLDEAVVTDIFMCNLWRVTEGLDMVDEGRAKK